MLNALSIINECADRIGWGQIDTLDKSTLSAKERKLLSLTNRVVQTWCGLDNWAMLRTEATIVLIADVVGASASSQYVTATQNSKTVTIDNVTLDSTYNQRAFQVDGDDYVYRIEDVPSPTTITLNRAWITDSITASDEKTFTIAQDRYTLPSDFDRIADDIENPFSPYKIQPVSPNEFRDLRLRYRGIHVDDPGHCTVWGTNPGETLQLIHFEPYPDSARILQFVYQRKHPKIDSDNDKIFVEDRYGEALIDVIVQAALRDYEDDERMQVVLLDALRKYNIQTSRREMTKQALVLRPENKTRADIRNAVKRSNLPIDYGDNFDY